MSVTRPRDGDGDGFVYDNTPRMRPWNPVTDVAYPDGEVPEAVKRRQRKARVVQPPGPKRPIERRPDDGWHDPRTAPPPVTREAIEAAYAYDDGTYFVRTTVEDGEGWGVAGHPLGPDTVRVNGDVYRRHGDGRDELVGNFRREVDPHGGAGNYALAHHEFLTLNYSERNRGLGSRLFDAQVKGLRAAGVDRILTVATTDPEAGSNGAYTWARAGFDWAPNSRPIGVAMALSGAAELIREEGGSEVDARLADDMAERLRRVRVPDDPAKLPDDYPTPNDVAILGWTPGAETWLGREVLGRGRYTTSGVRWVAALDLHPDRAQLDVDDIGELPNPFAETLAGGEAGSAPETPTVTSPVKLTTKVNTIAPDFTPEQSEQFARFLTRQTGMHQNPRDKYLAMNVRSFVQGYSTREWLDPLFTTDTPDPDAVALVQAWRKNLLDHVAEKGGDGVTLHRGVVDRDTDPFVPMRTDHWSNAYNDVRPQRSDAAIAGITSWTSVKTEAKQFGGHNVSRDIPVDQLIGRFGSIKGEVLVADDPLVTRALDAWPNDVDGVPAAPFGTFPERYRAARGADVPGTVSLPDNLDDLREGEVIEVPLADLLNRPDVWFDERDSRYGGWGVGPNQRGLDAWVPEMGRILAEGERIGGDEWIDMLGQSILTEGQREPIILSRQPDGTYWVGEGNHRLAAMERAGIETVKLKRGADYRSQMRGEGTKSTTARLGPRPDGAVTFYEVGGAVRDDLMGIYSDDVDFAVTAPSYEAMKEHLESEGFRIFQEREEFATIKAKVPDGHPLQARTHVADFVLARRDGPSSDGRRPDYTEPGTLEEDLARRDFTVNAIARDTEGNLIDPFGGQADIESRTLRFVGDPMTRVREDGLRVLRGFRFMVTKQLTPEPGTWAALTSDEAAEMLLSVSKERVSNELQKMLDYDTLGTVQLLGQLPAPVLDAIFRDGVRLAPNLGKVKGATRDPDLPRVELNLSTINPFAIDAGDGDVIELGSSPAGWERKPGPDRPIRRDGLPRRNVADWKRPADIMLSRAFVKDLSNGYRVRARASDGVVTASVYTPDGERRVGYANWKVRDDSPTAYLSLTALDEDQQGQGIGTEMFAAAVEALRDQGVDTIELLAMSSENMNGAYTWARAGFDWEPGSWDLPEFAAKLAVFARDFGDDYPDADRAEALRLAALLADRGKDLPYDPAEFPDDLPTPNDIAMIGWVPGASEWLGKDFLSGTDPEDPGEPFAWSGTMRIDALDLPRNPFAEQLEGGEAGSAAEPVPEPDVDLSSIVRTGNPHRWNSNSGMGDERTYFTSGDLSKRTVNARVAAIKKLAVDELPQLKGKKFEIRYWTDWDEYKNAVWPSTNSGSYPLAAWRDNGGVDGGPAVWVSPSIATSWFDDDPNTITNWKVLVHELVHAASPQRVSNSGADAVLEEGAAEILSTDITARRIADARVPFQQHRFDGGGTVPGIERLVRHSAYKERVAQLILHAADEEGVWDRDRIMARVRDWWDDGEYTSKYRRYERRGDARTREEMIEAETVKINAQYDDLIARLPQHAEEYEQNRRDLIDHLGTLYSAGNWQADANANWERMVASAEAAGVNVRRIVHTRDGGYYQYESPPFGMTPEQHADADTVADSLLYWLINGEAIDTAAGEAGAVAAEGPIAP